jgi:hypothetical protein
MPSRARRSNTKTLAVPMRDRDGTVVVAEVWREDRVEVATADSTATYLVLDFGTEEDVRDGQWVPTGRTVVAIQQIDPDTGEGLAIPTKRYVDPLDADIVVQASSTGVTVVDEDLHAAWAAQVRAWPDTTLLPVSPRRQA